MTELFRCGDAEALIGFLYEECSPQERAVIAAHLTVCTSCTEELASLSGTREQLTMWAPPDARLDFRLTGAQAHRPPQAPWWKQPLPAWAQLAAAVVIFAAGGLLGMRASSPSSPATSLAAVVAPQSTAAEFARLDSRLRSVENQRPERVVRTATTTSSDDGVLRQVRRELDERDDRLYEYLNELTLEFVKTAKAQQESIKTVRVDVDNRLDPLVKAVELSSRGNGD